MKKIIKLIFLNFFIISSVSVRAADSWVQKANMPTVGRNGGVGLSIGSKGYTGLGLNGAYFVDFWEYNPVNNTWTQKANFPGVGRMDVISFTIGSKGYVGTGLSATGRKSDFYEYDPATNIWSPKADFGGGPREDAVGFSIGTNGYVGTGISNTGVTQDFWEYNPTTNLWTQKADFGGGIRHEATGFSIGSKGYMGLGIKTTFTQDFWEYNPATDTWTEIAPFGGVARYIPAAFTINNRAYVGTGYGGEFYADFWEYDSDLNIWIQRANFPANPRWNVCAFSIGGKGYFGEGYSGPIYNDLFEYTPGIVVNTGSISGSPFCYNDPITINYTVSTTLSPGNIFTAQLSNPSGSFVTPVNLASVVSNTSGVIHATIPYSAPPSSSYKIRVIASDPSVLTNTSDITIGSTIITNEWIQKINFAGTARRNAVAFSIGSKGYLGTGNDGAYRKDFWEYDPTNDSWTQKADFGGVARAEACGFSIDNRGYIGTGYNGTYFNDFWEYNPVTNSWTQKANLTASGRRRAVGISIGSKGYIGTGENGTDKSDFWEYNPATNLWTQKASYLGGTVADAVGFSIGSKGYIGSGEALIFNEREEFYAYDPALNSWSSIADIPDPRENAVGFSVGDKGYVAMGADPFGTKDDVYEYDPVSNSWTLKASLPSISDGRVDAVAFAIDGKGYIATGSRNSVSKNDVFMYNPEPSILTNTISPLSFCSGGPVSVPYNAGGTYQCGNKFVAQLSDASGSFASPVNIGELSSTVSGIIDANLPTNAVTGIGYRIRVISLAPDVSASTNTKNNGSNITIVDCPVTLQMNVLLQNFYTGGGLMDNFGAGGCLKVTGHSANPNHADSITVSVMESNPPHNEVDHQKGILSTNGNITVSFNPVVVAYRSFYLKVSHRNSIDTWSGSPVKLLPSASYSFTSAASQAYGSNLSLTPDNFGFAIFGGDINRDGAVDGSDFLEINPSIENGDGGYAVGDLNGDGAVDGGDFLLLDVNIQLGVGAALP